MIIQEEEKEREDYSVQIMLSKECFSQEFVLQYLFITYLFYSQDQQIRVSTGTGKSLNHPDIYLHCS